MENNVKNTVLTELIQNYLDVKMVMELAKEVKVKVEYDKESICDELQKLRDDVCRTISEKSKAYQSQYTSETTYVEFVVLPFLKMCPTFYWGIKDILWEFAMKVAKKNGWNSYIVKNGEEILELLIGKNPYDSSYASLLLYTQDDVELMTWDSTRLNTAICVSIPTKVIPPYLDVAKMSEEQLEEVLDVDGFKRWINGLKDRELVRLLVLDYELSTTQTKDVKEIFG